VGWDDEEGGWFSKISIHPFSIPSIRRSGRGGAGAYPSNLSKISFSEMHILITADCDSHFSIPLFITLEEENTNEMIIKTL